MTESVTLRDMDRGSRSTGRKGFSPEINPVLLSFMSSSSSSSVLSCGEMVRPLFGFRFVIVGSEVWRDGSGSVSSYLVAAPRNQQPFRFDPHAFDRDFRHIDDGV